MAGQARAKEPLERDLGAPRLEVHRRSRRGDDRTTILQLAGGRRPLAVDGGVHIRAPVLGAQRLLEQDSTSQARLARAQFSEVCPAGTPEVIDLYLLGAHDLFNVPRDDTGNFLDGQHGFPLFSPRVSIDLTFQALTSQCKKIDSDRKAIAVWGGDDASYANPAFQDKILALYTSFAAKNCH